MLAIPLAKTELKSFSYSGARVGKFLPKVIRNQ